MKGFTAAELAEMQAADEEIDREFDAAYAHSKNKRNKYQRAYYKSHKDKLATKQKAYRESHKNELAAKKKAYRESHKDQWNAYQRKYYQKSKRRKQHVLSDKIQKEAS